MSVLLQSFSYCLTSNLITAGEQWRIAIRQHKYAHERTLSNLMNNSVKLSSQAGFACCWSTQCAQQVSNRLQHFLPSQLTRGLQRSLTHALPSFWLCRRLELSDKILFVIGNSAIWISVSLFHPLRK